MFSFGGRLFLLLTLFVVACSTLKSAVSGDDTNDAKSPVLLDGDFPTVGAFEPWPEDDFTHIVVRMDRIEIFYPDSELREEENEQEPTLVIELTAEGELPIQDNRPHVRFRSLIDLYHDDERLASEGSMVVVSIESDQSVDLVRDVIHTVWRFGYETRFLGVQNAAGHMGLIPLSSLQINLANRRMSRCEWDDTAGLLLLVAPNSFFLDGTTDGTMVDFSRWAYTRLVDGELSGEWPDRPGDLEILKADSLETLSQGALNFSDSYFGISQLAVVGDRSLKWRRVVEAIDAVRAPEGKVIASDLCLLPIEQYDHYLEMQTKGPEFRRTSIDRSSLRENTFVTRWNTANTNIVRDMNQITLPLIEEGSYDFTIDWGDGTQNRITAWDQPERTHTYEEPGEYVITIEGEILGWSFPQSHGPRLSRRTHINREGDQEKLIEIAQWGPLRLGNRGGYFAGASSLEITATDLLDLTGTTRLDWMFADCRSLSNVPSIKRWDLSQVTTVNEMFAGAKKFNSEIDKWDVSNITQMAYLFAEAESFDCPIGSWDISNVTVMRGMFQDAKAFNQDIRSWDISSVHNLGYLFDAATSFNQDIDGWDITHLTDLTGVFAGAESFNQDISGWNTSNVRNMTSTFRGASSFNQDISSWDTSQVRSMSSTFKEAGSFDQDISPWDTSQVRNMSSTFENTSSFNQDISSWDVSAVTTMAQMFSFARAFDQDISAWNTSNVANMDMMFYYARKFDQDIGQWDVSNVSSMRSMFDDAALSADNYDRILRGWAGQDVQREVNLGAKRVLYSTAAASARQHLMDELDWTIEDGGIEQ